MTVKPEESVVNEKDFLQEFLGEDATNDKEYDEFGDIVDPTAIDEEEQPEEEEAETEETVEDESETDEEAEKPDESVSDNEDSPVEEEPQKKEQTPEENAKFAEQRRQKQIEERVQQELEKRMQESPEYKVAKKLAEQYGVSTEEMLQRIEDAELQKQAEQQKLPVEYLRKQQEAERRIQEQEEKLSQMEFQNWYSQKQLEKESLLKQPEYSFLKPEEIDAALDYMLNDIGTVKMELEQAVHAKYGKRIAENLNKIAKQEALAEVSGRKKAPLAPQGGGKPQTSTLTAEERQVAQALGVSEEEYLKHR